MLLSEKTLDALPAALLPSYGTSGEKRRDAARSAVTAAAAELELDPLAPPLPNLDAGESVLRAGVRVLKLDTVEKALADAAARNKARERHSAEVAALYHRRNGLVAAELGRRRDQLLEGKVPGRMPAKQRDELAELDHELRVFARVDVDTLIPFEHERPLIEAALPARGLESVVFYAALVSQRLRSVSRNDHYQSKRGLEASRVDADVQVIGAGTLDQALVRTLGIVRAVVEVADLHTLLAPQPEDEISLEQLARASSGQRAAVSA